MGDHQQRVRQAKSPARPNNKDLPYRFRFADAEESSFDTDSGGQTA